MQPPVKNAIAELGIRPGPLRWNLSEPQLVEETIRRGAGRLARGGPLVVDTTPYTGRSPKDKFVVRQPSIEDEIAWGKVNQPISDGVFDALYLRVCEHLSEKELFVQDLCGGTDREHQMSVRLVSESPWHALFARNLLVRPSKNELADYAPQYHIVHAPEFEADPARDGTRSEAFVMLNLERRIVMIGGTRYAGEIKKSVFTLLNFLLPKAGILAMHCSANVGADGDTALFFGLSGTGKTTLSADPERPLIGDDEHGWSEDGVFNFEGGCYAKVIKLDPEAEPEIFECTRRFGTLLENVAMDYNTRRLDLDDASFTENTRAGYPLTHISNSVPDRRGGHPKNVIMLTCDAYGIMPPVAKLTPEQAMYHFISGYTAKVAGTERGMSREPSAIFSTCFGAPFMALHPSVYANLLGERIAKHKVDCWLVNTGWTGGPYGVGNRMAIAHTRAMINAILNGDLKKVQLKTDPIFGLQVPVSCPNVPDEVLDPRGTWKNPKAYDEKARELAEQFIENFKEYEESVGPEIIAAGPQIPSGKKAAIKQIK